MKTNRREILIGIAVACLFSASFASAAPLDLSPFKGKYNGTVTQVGPGGTQTGTAVVQFKVPPSGTSAVIDYTATVSDGMNTTVLPTSLAIAKNKSVAVTDLLVGIAGTNNAKPGTGRASKGRRKMTINASNGEGISLSVSAVAKDLRNKRKLTLILISDDGVDPTTFTTILKARLPRR